MSRNAGPGIRMSRHDQKIRSTTPFTTLRHVAVAGALIVAVAACSSAAAPTPTAATSAAAVSTAVSTATPTAVPTAAATAIPSPTIVPGLSWKYSRDFVAKAFTDKFALVFKQEIAGSKPGNDPTWVDSPFLASGLSVSIRGVTSGGDSNVTAVVLQNSTLSVSADKEMVFALNLMIDANVASTAVDWLESEFTKANADKKTAVDDKTTIGSAKLHFQANEDLGSGFRSGSGLRIDPAS